MQALCQWDVQREASSEMLREFLAAEEATSRRTGYAVQLVEAFWARQEMIDDAIASAAQRWELARISLVERNIMRIAVVELTDGFVPPKVALSEAIEVGREFGGAESPRFINGVLDEVFKRLQRKSEGNG